MSCKSNPLLLAVVMLNGGCILHSLTYNNLFNKAFLFSCMTHIEAMDDVNILISPSSPIVGYVQC